MFACAILYAWRRLQAGPVRPSPSLALAYTSYSRVASVARAHPYNPRTHPLTLNLLTLPLPLTPPWVVGCSLTAD